VKVLIHDLTGRQESEIIKGPTDIHVISDNGNIHPCVGCFGCWLKTPGRCVVRDGYDNIGETLSKCDELFIVSRCCYGGFSPFVKNVFDRSISYILPDFTFRNGKMHHKSRYENKFEMNVYFYGNDISDREKQLAKDIVQANALNFNCKVGGVHFAVEPEQFGGEIR
jgi:multimeric flavodoxin WrbA